MLGKVRSKFCLTAIVDARLVDSRIIVHDANKACIKINTYRIRQHDFIYSAAFPLNTGVSAKNFLLPQLNKMCAKISVTELFVYLCVIF